MSNEELVSIIMPCYNAANYIYEAMISIEKQTYSNLELIIVDDGSTDKSYEIINRFKKESSLKIEYFCQKNKGVSVARNKGIQLAHGHYLIFMDADDVISKSFISSLVFYSDKNMPSVCHFSRDLKKVLDVREQDITSETMNIEQLARIVMRRNPPINFYNFIFFANVIKENHLYFLTDLKYGEDNEFMWKYVSFFEKFTYINAPLYGYRINYKSASFSQTDRIIDSVTAIERVIQYMKDNKQKTELCNQLEDYMLPRTKLAVIKDFAKQGNHKAYTLYRTNKYTKCDYYKIGNAYMTVKELVANFLIFYLPTCFYYTIRIIYKLSLYRFFMK